MTLHNNFHDCHMVDVSPWPLFMGIGSLNLFISVYFWTQGGGKMSAVLALILSFFVFFLWMRDMTREATLCGDHTMKIMISIKFGMVLFILSEVFFFVSFFWAFFHSSLNPNMEIGYSWPPLGLTPLNPSHIPLLNTLVLLSSGVTITISHHKLLGKEYEDSILWLFLTISLGVYFTYLQFEEYQTASFTISDSVYGSVFFLTTGFHGLHVIVGSMFLSASCYRLLSGHMSSYHHLGFEMAGWYWHFVDLVWLFVYSLIYWWG